MMRTLLRACYCTADEVILPSSNSMSVKPSFVVCFASLRFAQFASFSVDNCINRAVYKIVAVIDAACMLFFSNFLGLPK